MAFALRRNEILSKMPETIAKEDEKISKALTCRGSQKSPIYFKVIDLLRDDTTFKSSQAVYLNTLDIPAVPGISTKDELQSKLTRNRPSCSSSSLLNALGSPRAHHFFMLHSSTSVQHYREDHITTFTNLQPTHFAGHEARSNIHDELKCIPLDNLTVTVRVYAYSAFQNQRSKHYKIVFAIYISKRHKKANIVNWDSSRNPPGPQSTEQVYVMTLSVPCRSSET